MALALAMADMAAERLEHTLMRMSGDHRGHDLPSVTGLPDSVLERMDPTVISLDPVLMAQRRARKERDLAGDTLSRDLEARKREARNGDENALLCMVVSLRDHTVADFESTYKDIQDLLDRKSRALAARFQEAQMNLRLVQAQAIVLADGRRVYFLKNGEQAKDESGRLLEGRDLDEARRIREQRQDAATYEAYQESCREYRSVAGEKARLEAYWQKWRDLNEDVRAGRISGEALKRRQAELLDELDPEDREAILRARPERRRLYEEYKDEHRFADDKRGMRAEAGFAVGEDAVGGMAARARSLEESLNALDAALDRPAPARQIAALRLEN